MNSFKIIDLIRGTSIISKYCELKYYDRLNINDLLVEQAKRLSHLLLKLRSTNRYYTKILQSIGEKEIINEPAEVLRMLTITDKKHMTDNYDNIFLPDRKQRLQKKQTGGSTGAPFRYILNPESVSHTWAFVYKYWNKYAGYQFGDKYISIAGNSFHSRRKRILEQIYYRLQNNYFLSGDIITENMKLNTSGMQLAKLIYGYPSSIHHILSYNPSIAVHLKKLEGVFTTSEILLPAVREKIENTLGCPVFDMYGANDGGIVSSECHYHSGYHYNMLNCYVESMKNEYGESELILTSLNNLNFPFIRYRVGDLGDIETSPCRCGSPFLRLINIKGRTRDLIYQKDSKCFHGSLFNTILGKYPEIKLYKIIQEKDYTVKLKLKIEPEEKFEPVAEKLAKEFNRKFKDLVITISKLDHIDATNDKFRVIESNVS